MKTIKYHMAGLGAFLFFSVQNLEAQAQEGATYVPRQITIGLEANLRAEEIASRISTIGVIARQNESISSALITLQPKMDVEKSIELLKRIPGITFAEPNYYCYGGAVPNDSYYSSSQYGPQKVKANLAWSIWQPQSSIILAVLDTGVQYTHPDLQNKLLRDQNCNVRGYTFISGTSTANDDNGHGTHCAGIAAAETNNATGISGIAGWNGQAGWQDTFVKIMPVKCLDNNNNGDNDTEALAVTTAVNQGAKILSISIESYGNSTNLANSINYALTHDCVVVSISGNNGSTVLKYPGAYSGVISVAASDSNDMLAGFSNYGSWVSIAAPGGQGTTTTNTETIYSTWLNSGYAGLAGTSMACPHVSGTAALMWAQNPSLSATQVHDLILSTADTGVLQIYPGKGAIGGGRLNAYKALVAATGRVQGVRDFNNDGDPDFLFQTNDKPVYWYTDTPNVYTTTITGRALTSSALTSSWRVSGAGYFNSDSSPDLVLTHPTDKRVHIWYMNGTTRTSGQYLYRINPTADLELLQVNTFLGTGDFDNNGYSDVAWFDTATRKIGIWELSGAQFINGPYISEWQGSNYVPKTLPTGWSVVAVGDMDYDGDPDLLLLSPTREVHVWYLNGTTWYSGAYVLNPSTNTSIILPADWEIVGVADFNADGLNDIVVQSQKLGRIDYWQLTYSGTQIYYYSSVTPKVP